MQQKRILVVYQGGTIGMVQEDPKTGLAPGKLARLLPHLPEIERLNCELDFLSVPNPQDSSNNTPDDWVQLAQLIADNYHNHDGFVVLHGTDTMAWTASALSFMLENLAKPVIFTGSVLPLDVIRSDGRENFITALEIALNPQHTLHETAICFDSKLYRGNRAIKYSSAKFRAFVTPNYPVLAENGYELEFYKHYWLPPPPPGNLRAFTALDTNVAMLKFYPGITPQVVDAFLGIPNLRAIVLETYGNGNLPKFPWLIDRLQQAIQQGVLLYNVTQCTAGKVQQGKYATSKSLKEIGVQGGHDLTTAAAATKLMYLFGKLGNDPQAVRHWMQVPLRGELLANERREVGD
jgi:L-asparaginase